MKKALLPVVVALAALAVTPVRGEEEASNFLEAELTRVTLGKGFQSKQITLFPLLAPEEPEPLDVAAASRSSRISWVEPAWPRRRYDLALGNGEKRTVLALGGLVLTGGKLDRMVPHDLLVEPGTQVEFEALPAEYPQDRRKEAKPFRPIPGIAPMFLRERARFDPSRYMVPIFVSHFLEFRDKGDERRSLAAIDGATALNRYCEACQKGLDGFREMKDRKAVGFVTAVRGRIHCLELFATNALLRAYFAKIIRSHTYTAAVIELRAEKLGMPLPGDGDPQATLKAAEAGARELLGALRKARYREEQVPRGAAGEVVALRARSAVGTGIGLEGRLVHATVFPDEPFEDALFSRRNELPPQVGDGDEASFGEMERREGRGTLSEYEKRLLERMRRRR